MRRIAAVVVRENIFSITRKEYNETWETHLDFRDDDSDNDLAEEE